MHLVADTLEVRRCAGPAPASTGGVPAVFTSILYVAPAWQSAALHALPAFLALVREAKERNTLGKHRVVVCSSCRHISFKRHLPRQMHVSSMDYGMDAPAVAEQPTSIGRIKPELYKQKSVDSEDPKKEAAKTCGKINFTLKYDYETETLSVRILRAFDLPAKDFCGSSDPYVKIYLLPDRKRKFQTRVHRKTLNPTFDESFHFPVPHEELGSRKLHLSVFDFDRFSRHDMIGEVILENLFEASDLSRETSIWQDIQYATTVSVCSGGSPTGSAALWRGADTRGFQPTNSRVCHHY